MKSVLFNIFILISILGFSEVKEFSIQSESKEYAVGEVINVNVNVLHDEALKLYFPTKDSILGKFEVVTKKTSPTIYTQDSLLVDHAVYGVRTFELTDSLPFYITISEGDNQIRSNVIWFKIGGGVIESKKNQLIPDSSYVSILLRTNKNLYISFLILFVILFVLFLIYGIPKVIQFIKKKRFIKKHELFKTTVYEVSWQSKNWENYISKWRDDLSRSKSKSFSGLTFLQLKKEINSEDLNPIIDKMQAYLYNPESLKDLDLQDFEKLNEYADEAFKTKLNQWKK